MVVLTLVEYLDDRLGDHKGRGPEYMWFCHQCLLRVGTESNSPQLAINLKRNVGRCFRCEFKFRGLAQLFRSMNQGTLMPVEFRYLERGPSQVVEQSDLTKTVLRILGTDTVAKVEKLKPIWFPKEMKTLLPRTDVVWLRAAWEYLDGRGIGEDLVYQYQIQYCPIGHYGSRLLFPIVMRNQLVSFQTRYVGDNRDEPKAMNAPKADGYYGPSTTMLNFDAVLGEPVVAICEGAFDVMAHEHAVGLGGKEMSDAHIVLLEELVENGTDEFVISLDAGAGAASDKLYSRLVGRLPKVTVLTLDHGDPDDRREELDALMRTSAAPDLSDRVAQRFGK